jgi:hypothetical protein
MPAKVRVELFDKPRNLLFDVNAIADVEEVLGKGIGEVFKEENAGFSMIRALLCHGLKHEDQSMTPTRAGKMMQKALESGVSLQEIMEKVTEAIAKSEVFPKAQPEDEAEDPLALTTH